MIVLICRCQLSPSNRPYTAPVFLRTGLRISSQKQQELTMWGGDVLIMLILAIIPQCIRISNHHIVHFKYVQLCLSLFLSKAGQNKSKISKTKEGFFQYIEKKTPKHFFSQFHYRPPHLFKLKFMITAWFRLRIKPLLGQSHSVSLQRKEVWGKMVEEVLICWWDNSSNTI